MIAFMRVCWEKEGDIATGTVLVVLVTIPTNGKIQSTQLIYFYKQVIVNTNKLLLRSLPPSPMM